MSYKKIFVVVMILSLFFPFFPQKSYAQYVDLVQAGKELGLDTVAYYIGQRALKKLTSQTVNWINSGFKGNPAFVTDPGQFFLDTADSVASQYLSETALNQLCSPFKAQVRLALVKNYLQDQDNYSCTLSTLKNNYEAFTQDFSQGGWDGWFEMTQTSGGNPYSAYFAAESGLLKNIGSEKSKKEKQLEQGQGFLSYEKCKPGTELTPQQVINWYEYDGRIYQAGDCLPKDKEVVTPGSVINNSLGEALGSGWKQLQAADEINEIVTALVSQMIKRVVGGVGNGLLGASRPSTTGGTSFTTDLSNEPQENPVQLDPLTQTQGTMHCTTDADGNQDCTITPGTTSGEDWLPTISTGGGTDPGTPAETPSGFDSMCASVAAERNAFPSGTISRDDIATILNNVARNNNANGWGLLSKPSGTNCPGAISCDIMFHGPTCYIYDVLGSASGMGNAGGVATPQCNFAGGNMDRNRWIGVGADTRGGGPCSAVIPAGGGGGGGGGGGISAPADAGTKHGDHTFEVGTAKNDLLAQGRVYDRSSPTYECDRFEITLNAARLIGGDAGLLATSGGTNCQGYAVDIIAFSDGYIYDVLDGAAPDGAGPAWMTAACGSNGACPDRYRTTP